MKTHLILRPALIVATLIAFAGVTQAGEPAASLVSLQEETFSLPIADAFALLRKSPSDAERYNELVRRVDAKQARLERLMVVRTISGQQAKGESVHELIYPTEYVPTRAAKTNVAAATMPAEGVLAPGGFQTRNLGDTLNFTPQIGPDSRTIMVTLIPESSFFVGYKGAGSQKWTHQPMFRSQRLTTSVVVKDGEPFLLGTFTPPMNNGIAAPQKEHRIWLDFITVHILPGGK
ncbi:MAG: type II and III secretion system protein [Verrucomicrobia bacterium]|nr:type II and III secretion system protein [Verrucomicrobiota bacterium]